jgi:cell division protein FtsN
VAVRGKRADGGTGTFLLFIGVVAVLAGTFLLGVMAGRFWAGFPLFRGEVAAKAPPRGREREARAPEASPTLTFYQELTAPLTAPPPAKPAKPRAEASRPEAAKPEGAAGRFTVQAGAYKAREPAEALRTRLAAAGHDAYVAEAESTGGVRFRVRVGTFATREAAQEVAARLAAEGTLSTFVTAR